jgi:hypothetical protein
MAKNEEQDDKREKSKHEWLPRIERRRPENAVIRRWFKLADSVLRRKPKPERSSD